MKKEIGGQILSSKSTQNSQTLFNSITLIEKTKGSGLELYVLSIVLSWPDHYVFNSPEHSPKTVIPRKEEENWVSLFTFDIQSVGKQMGNSGPEISVFSMNIN